MNKNVKKVVIRPRGNPSVIDDGRKHYSAEVTYTDRFKGATECSCEMKFTTDSRVPISYARYEIGLILDIEGDGKTAAFALQNVDGQWIHVYTGNHY